MGGFTLWMRIMLLPLSSLACISLIAKFVVELNLLYLILAIICLLVFIGEVRSWLRARQASPVHREAFKTIERFAEKAEDKSVWHASNSDHVHLLLMKRPFLRLGRIDLDEIDLPRIDEKPEVFLHADYYSPDYLRYPVVTHTSIGDMIEVDEDGSPVVPESEKIKLRELYRLARASKWAGKHKMDWASDEELKKLIAELDGAELCAHEDYKLGRDD